MASNGFVSLGNLDYLVLIGFIVVTSVVGYFAGRGEQADTKEYFLAGRKLPWYVVSGSYIMANISTEQLIWMVGGAYIFGVTMALWEWLNAFTFLFLIFLFIPCLISSKIVTIPQFLERRYSRSVRQIFAVFIVIANIVIFLAAVLYSGGLALSAFTGWDLMFCIIATGILSGVWAIYGGLSSVAWTGFVTAFDAPPFAAIFLLGLLWRKANSTGALWAIAGGFFVGVSLKVCGALFDLPGWFYPFQNQAAVIWMSSMLFCIVGSQLGKPNRELSEISDILVLENPSVLKQGLGDKWYKSVWL